MADREAHTSINTVHRKYASVQVLRGLAALSVVLYHALARFDTYISALAIGVDVFFVISGFVMVVSTNGKHVTRSRFLKKRIQRIVPLYWIALFATLVAIACHLIDRPMPPVSEIFKAFFFIFYTDSFFKQPVPFLGIGWTLNYEMLFYILFSISMFLGTARQIIVLSGIFLVAVLMRKFIDPADGFSLRMTSPLPFEFVMGMVVAYFREWLSKRRLAVLIGALTIGLVVIASDIQGARTLSGGIPSAMIVAALVGLDGMYPWESMRLPMAIGDASYALYLFHGLVIILIVPIIPSYFAIAGPIILIASSVVFSLLVYRFVERPIIDIFRLKNGEFRSNGNSMLTKKK
jgi:exopolysaccharide production protein ExoZ